MPAPPTIAAGQCADALLPPRHRGYITMAAEPAHESLDTGLKHRTASFSSLTDDHLRAGSVASGDDTEAATATRAKLWQLMGTYLPSDKHSLQRSIANHAEYTLAGTRFNLDPFKAYSAAAHSVRDRLIEAWNDTNSHWEATQPKRGYYISMEYLMGRYLQNALLNMDLAEPFSEAVRELGFTMEELLEQEPDPALGNGGLGRLAACFLDSMATLDLPAWGYGLRYTYGIFRQQINEAGQQCELPDRWLTFVTPW